MTPPADKPAAETQPVATPDTKAVQPEPVVAPAPDAYPRKLLKPHRLAKHYGFAPSFHWDVLGFGFYGLNVGSINNTKGGYAFGARTNFDIGHLAIFGQFERFVSDSKGKAMQLDQGKIMVGGIPVSTPYGRLRLLVGMDIMSMAGGTAGSVVVSPVLGVSGRLGNGLVGMEAAGLFGIYPMFQAEARVALVLRVTFVQLHLGYQMSYRSAGPGTSPGVNALIGNAQNEFMNGPMIHGPHGAIGFGW